jgi:HlyD family secretion protein
MSKPTLTKLLILLILAVSIAACSPNDEVDSLTASGTISATSLNISSELGGRIAEIFVSSGDTISVGDVLFKLDDEILQAQYNQAAAGVKSAEAAYQTALEQQNAAELQLALAEQGARFEELQSTESAASTTWPEDFLLPAWYYPSDEERTAIAVELANAEEALAKEQQTLADWIEELGDEKLVELETDLAAAQQTYLTTSQTLMRFSQPDSDEQLRTLAQDAFDEAKTDLDNLQRDLERILSEDEFAELLEARGRVLLAQNRVDAAELRRDASMVGEESLLVASAEANVAMAEAQVAQALAGIDQANAALTLLQIQLSKATIASPMAGTIISESLEVGQLVGAGMTTMTIAMLDIVELTVYVPEDQYGVINIGDEVSIQVDSYPEKTFSGVVEFIADQAEFTPRNVQTVEGRKATVYAIRISLLNPDLQLKPGMPADVTFLN